MDRSPSRLYRRAQRTCARCRNHSEHILVRGHKRYCKFRNCMCDKCLQTAQRQKLMAAQTAQRRADEEDRRRSKVEVESLGGSRTSKIPYRPYEMVPSHKPSLADLPHYREASKQLRESVALLQGMCDLPPRVAPLLHIILTHVSSNPITVYRLYLKAKEELAVRGLVDSDVTVALPLPDGKMAPLSLPSTTTTAALYDRLHQLSVHCDACLSASLYQGCYPMPKYDIVPNFSDKSDSQSIESANFSFSDS